MILYSELDQLNHAYPSLGGETFLSYSGLRSFLWDPQEIWQKENAVGRKSLGYVLLPLFPFPEPFPPCHLMEVLVVPVLTLFAFSLCSLSLHLLWGSCLKLPVS